MYVPGHNLNVTSHSRVSEEVKLPGKPTDGESCVPLGLLGWGAGGARAGC